MLYRIPRKKHGRICIINGPPNSGSNCMTLYKYIISNTGHKDVFITDRVIGANLRFKDMYKIATSHIFISSHSTFKVSKDRIGIQLWHGIPLKCMNYMDNVCNRKIAERNHKHFNNFSNYVISSSDFYNVLMSACMGIPVEKYIKTGFPRNDLLFKSSNKYKDIIFSLFEEDSINKNTKIIMYLPTFRIGHKGNKIEGKLKKGNIFGFNTFNSEKIDVALKENNCVLIAKLHPLEERLALSDKFDTSQRIKIISSTWLSKIGEDLYSFLSISDMLVTDYSSVYFDYLLLNRPIIFINSDLDEYRKSRGLLLEPYDFWTPGYKVKTEDELIDAIYQYVKNTDIFQNERKFIRDILYEEKGNSCERIWKELLEPIIKSK